MPLPQVNDRLKEIPAQALRTLFATVGQLILVADRFPGAGRRATLRQRRVHGHPAR